MPDIAGTAPRPETLLSWTVSAQRFMLQFVEPMRKLMRIRADWDVPRFLWPIAALAPFQRVALQDLLEMTASVLMCTILCVDWTLRRMRTSAG